MYVDTGDIEGEGQRLNAPYMVKSNVARNPHHFANLMGYFDFYNALDPDMWLVTLDGYDTADRPESHFYPQYAYLYRYSNYGYAKDVRYPDGADMQISWLNGFTYANGEQMRKHSTLTDAAQWLDLTQP